MISSELFGTRDIAVGFSFLIVLSMLGSSAQSLEKSQTSSVPSKVGDRNDYVGNEACARCYSAIYESYQKTSMAHASGPAIDALTPAEFTHKESGIHYRIYGEDGRAWLGFDRPGDPAVQ